MFHFFPREQTDPFAPPAFQLDATTREDYETATEWTKVPIEAQATVSDFHYVQPEVYRVEGIISPIMPFAAPRGVDGVKDQIGELVRLLKAGVVLTCVFGFDTIDIALSKAARSLSHSDGFALRVRLEFIEIRQITTERVTVRLATRRLKKVVKRQAPPVFAQKWVAQGGKRASKIFSHHMPNDGSIVPTGPVLLKVDPEAD